MTDRIIHVVVAITSWLSLLAMIWCIAFRWFELDALRIACMAIMGVLATVSTANASDHAPKEKSKP